jgi:hypothetical protein
MTELALAMFRAGRSNEHVAAACGICVATARAWRRELGLPPVRRRSAGLLTWADECERLRLIERANDMLVDGVQRARICVELGISIRTLARYIRPELRGALPKRYSANTRRKAREHCLQIQSLGAAATGRQSWPGHRYRRAG